MATLGSVRSAIFPGAVPVRPLTKEEAEREIAWVRVLKARTPAFDALEPGDLAIVPGIALAAVAPNDMAIEQLADELARAGVAAALLCDARLEQAARAGAPGLTGEARPDASAATGALDALAGATGRAGLPTLRLLPADPLSLERSVIAYLVNQAAELERRAAELDGQLARLALAGGGLSTLAAAIGEFFGRAVAIENPGGETLAIHAPTDPPSAAGAAARYLARTLGSIAALRIVIPAVPGERGSGGRLLLLGDEPADEVERVAGERIAGVLGLELARSAALAQAREEVRRGEPLPADGPPWVAMMARQGPFGPADDAAVRERVRAGLRGVASARRLLLRGTSDSLEIRMVAAAPADDPMGAVIAGQIAAYLDRTVAVSGTFPDAAGRPAAEAAARSTLEAAEALVAPPPVAYAARLPAYLLLGNLHNIPDAPRQARTLLAALSRGRSGGRDGQMETLRRFLEVGGVGETAVALGVHRNTVAYRLEAIQRATGWDLHDPDLRLALAVAIRIVQRERS